jgi:hypothetical protein
MEIALKSNSLKVLQYVWESSYESQNLKKKKSIFINNTIRSSISNKLRKSINPNSLNTYLPNKQKNKSFNVSQIISHYSQNKSKHNFLSEIMKWKYLEFDMDLLTTLFTHLCFNEIYTLMWKQTNHSWTFTKDQFRIVINNGEQLDLILYFLNLRECRLVLDEVEIQRKIVKHYMK